MRLERSSRWSCGEGVQDVLALLESNPIIYGCYSIDDSHPRCPFCGFFVYCLLGIQAPGIQEMPLYTPVISANYPKISLDIFQNHQIWLITLIELRIVHVDRRALYVALEARRFS